VILLIFGSGLFLGIAIGAGGLLYFADALFKRDALRREDLSLSTVRRYWVMVLAVLSIWSLPSGVWAASVASWATPLVICGAGAAGDVWSTDHALSRGAVEVGPIKSESGRIAANIAACGAYAWLDTSIQSSAHPHRVWIARGGVIVLSAVKFGLNSLAAAHPRVPSR
jgi:hypothetical protein